jgi:AcrR family transcriptional regulator
MRALPGSTSRASFGDAATAQQQDQRRRILRATGELVAKRGYHDVSVELIAKRAKVSFQTFYKHFSGKEEAFVALFDEVTGEARERILSALSAEPEAPWEKQIVLALRELFDVILSDPIIARATIVEAPTVGPAIADRYEEAMLALEPLIRLGRDVSPRGARLPETLEETLAGGVLWSSYQRLIAGEVDRIEALLPEAIVFVLRSYVGEAEARKWAEWSADPVAEIPSTVR